MILITFFIFAGIPLLTRSWQTDKPKRGQFSLKKVEGIHSSSLRGSIFSRRSVSPQGGRELIQKYRKPDAPLKAILISDHVRLALIDHHIVSLEIRFMAKRF